MALRCFVFTSDEGTAALIRQILADLGVETDPCPDAVVAAEKITSQNFQIVIIDWDQQPEAALLLTTARERKASERALTLAIVSDDQYVPVVLQAGANSILRKPIILNHAKDTLTTARDLLRAKQDSAAGVTHAAAAAASAGPSSLPPSLESKGTTLRAGEFLVTGPVKPGAQFETESDLPLPSEHSSAIAPDPLMELEPVAGSVSAKSPEPSLPAPPPIPPPPPPADGETRGLEWYKTRAAARFTSPAAPEPPRPSGNPELLGFDQISSQLASPATSAMEPVPPAPKLNPPAPEPARETKPQKETKRDEQKAEAELFAYLDGERAEPPSPSRFRLGKRAIFAALVLASFAIAAAPQAPWHPKLRTLLHSGQKSLRSWLNPQPVTAVQEAPPAHEDLSRPGDEYKLPVAENIPDATTDPSQIQVLPVVDPTAKKPNPETANAGQTPASTDGSLPTYPPQPQNPQSPDIRPTPAPTAPAQPTAVTAAPAAAQPVTVTVASLPPQPSNPPVASSPAATTPAPAKPSPQPHLVSAPANVPLSLQSQLAPNTPDPVGKSADTSLPSIEPVSVAEAAERALLADQPDIPYPANAKGQQGTVVLQILVGRDGTVQDAKFFQGSFLFARDAIDGVKQWKFKPYILNGRPVSIQTTLTLKFKPAQ